MAGTEEAISQDFPSRTFKRGLTEGAGFMWG
jgi:hypothetical protein